jgi:methionyl aminopeptidase
MKKYRGAFIKNDREIAGIREANRIGATILDAIGDAVQPNIPTLRLEELVQDLCASYKVKPAFQGYCGFPFALCCSVNEQVVHGFPSTRLLKEGDIVSCDFGVVYDGFISDSARTFAVGEVSDETARLLQVTEESLYVGIKQAQVGADVNAIGAAIQAYVESHGFGVVRRYVGHGVGAKLHEKPEVPNFKLAAQGMSLQAGMVIAIEPMVTVGSYEVNVLDDQWTAVTSDGKYAAHFEHSVAITPSGPRILSVSDRGLSRTEFMC